MRKIAIIATMLIVIGSMIYSSEITVNQKSGNGITSVSEKLTFRIESKIVKYQEEAVTSNESTAKLFIGLGAPVMGVGVLFIGGGIALIAAYAVRIDNIKKGYDIMTDSVGAMAGGGAALIAIGALFFFIGLPCLIYGAVQYGKIVKANKVSMFMDMDKQDQRIGVLVRL